MNEQEKFLQDLEGGNTKPDLLEQPLTPEKEGDGTADTTTDGTKKEDGDDEMQLRNRRERRLAAKLEAERTASIQLAARLEAITEAQKARQEAEPSEYLKSVERIYGTNSPEAQEATSILQQALKGVEKQATERALEIFREEQRAEAERVRKEEEKLDNMVEEIEDEHSITLNDQQKKGFYSMLEKMSPKDANGNIIAYADHEAVWEAYSDKIQKKPDTRAKDLSSRSMVTSGASKESNLTDDATARFLKEQGII